MTSATRTSRELLGTAGGVKKNEDFLGTGTFLVMSGDALTDIDLTGLVAAHRRNGSIATIAVKEVADPSLYGVVVTDDDGRVVGFQEKPSREEARSHLCNCGIYVFEPEILSLIPAGEFDDFGSRLFPDLLKQHVAFHAHSVRRLLERRGQSERVLPGQRRRAHGQGGGGDARRTGAPGRLGGRGRLLGAVGPHRASGARWAADAPSDEDVVIEGPAVLGDRTVVGAGAHIVRAVVLPDSQVPSGSVIVEGIVGRKPGYRHEP